MKITEGSYVLLFHSPRKKWLLKAEQDKKMHTHLGIIDLSLILGMEYGATVMTSLEKKIYLIEPTIHDFVMKSERNTQIVYPKDLGFIAIRTGIQNGSKVLEIGTGSAYQACVLADMGAQVYTIERQKKLFDSNKTFTFIKKYPNIKFFYGDGYEGLPTFAPFDKVLITAAAPEIPQKLIAQMKIGGMMVIPVGSGDVQVMKRLIKEPDGSLKEEVYDRFSFVPMLTGAPEPARMVDANRVALWYFPQTAITATTHASELFTVEEGHIVEIRLVFDRMSYVPREQQD